MKRRLISFAAMAMTASMALSTGVWADAAQSRYFVDMNDKSYGFWAIDEVDGLCEKGVVKGVGENKFAPANLMERGDFVLMLENAFHYPAVTLNKYNFVDVSQDDYYFTAVNNARGNGICEDTPIFRPEAPIKRIEAFKMLYNTMNVYGCVGSSGSTDVSMYSDNALLLNVSDKIAVGTITKLGIIQGSNGELKPNDTVTRAEMAVMISKAIEVYEANGSKPANTGTVQELKPILSGAQAHPNPDRVTDSEEKITETVLAEDGGEETVDGNEIAVATGNGAVADGSGSRVVIEGSKISTKSNESIGVSAINGGEAELDNVNINISSKGSTGVYVDRDSSAVIESSKVFVRGDDGSAIVNKGSLDITDSNVQAVKTDAIKTEGGTDLDITDSTITAEGKNSCILVKESDDNSDKVTINLSGVEFKAKKDAAAIMVDNAKVVINIKNVVLEGVEKLLATRYTYSQGIRDTEVTINLDGQKLDAVLEADDMAVVNLNLTNGSTYKGVINYSNTAKSMNVEMTGDSTLELDDDWYVDAFVVHEEMLNNGKYFSDIVKDKGHNIYYNADNDANYYLNDESYSLQNGGTLQPYNVD